MKTTIISQNVLNRRQDLGLSRADVVNKAKELKLGGLTERTLLRIEDYQNHKTVKAQEKTVRMLQHALRITKKALTGEEPMPKKRELRDTGKTSMKLDPGLQVQFDLIEERYMVRNRELIALAPLLFTLLAEATIVWHRKRQTQLENAVSDLEDVIMLNETFPGENILTDFHTVLGHTQLIGFTGVDEKNLFSDADNEWNPFVAFLRHFLKQMKKDDSEHPAREGKKSEKDWENLVHFIDTSYPGDKAEIPFSILDGLFNKIVNDNEKARETLWAGDIRIRQIPRDLFSEEQNKNRAEFIAKHHKPVDMLKEFLERRSRAKAIDIDDAIEKLAGNIAERKGIGLEEAEAEASQVITEENIKKMAEFLAEKKNVDLVKVESSVLDLLANDFIGRTAEINARDKKISLEEAETKIIQRFFGNQKGGKDA